MILIDTMASTETVENCVETEEVWSVAKLKGLKLAQLSESQKVILKASRPTPALALSQDCTSRGDVIFLN